MPKIKSVRRALILAELLELEDAEVERLREPEPKRRRWWIRPWLDGTQFGRERLLVHNSMYTVDPEAFTQALRLSPELFDEVLRNIDPLIKRQDTTMRDAIPSKIRLMIFLEFIASGSMIPVSYDSNFKIY